MADDRGSGSAGVLLSTMCWTAVLVEFLLVLLAVAQVIVDPGPVSIAIATLLLLLAFLPPVSARRRAGERFLCPPDAFPELWALTRSTAAALGTSAVDRIAFDDGPDVAARRTLTGARLMIGLQLWPALRDDERRAAVAHALARLVDGSAAGRSGYAFLSNSLRSWDTDLRADEALASSRVAAEAAGATVPAWRLHPRIRATSGGLTALLLAASGSVVDKLARRCDLAAGPRGDQLAADIVGVDAMVSYLSARRSGPGEVRTALGSIVHLDPKGGAVRAAVCSVREADRTAWLALASADVEQRPEFGELPSGRRIAALQALPAVASVPLAPTALIDDPGMGEAWRWLQDRLLEQGRIDLRP